MQRFQKMKLVSNVLQWMQEDYFVKGMLQLFQEALFDTFLANLVCLVVPRKSVLCVPEDVPRELVEKSYQRQRTFVSTRSVTNSLKNVLSLTVRSLCPFVKLSFQRLLD